MTFVFIHAAEIVILVALSFAVNRIRGRRFDLFEPLTVVNLVFLLYYSARPVFLMLAIDSPMPSGIAGNPALPIDYAWATGYAVLGLFCFHSGYFSLRERKAEPVQLQFWSRCGVTRVAIVGGVLALVSVAVGVYAAGGSGALSHIGNFRYVTAGWGYALIGTCFFPIVTALLWVDHLLGKPRKRWIAIFGTLSFLWAAVMGNRTGMFALIVSLVAVYAYIRGIRSYSRFALKSLVAGVVLVPVIIFWSYARDVNTGISDIARIALSVGDKDPRVIPEVALGEFSAVDAHAAIIHGGPSVFPFQYGKTYSDVVLFLVPRGLWPDKPAAFSNSVGLYVTGVEGWDMPPGAIGELYINFHVFGIIGGMFLLGRMIASAHRSLICSYGGIAFYALMMPYFGVFLSRNFIGGGVLLLTTVIPMWPAVRYISKRPDWLTIGLTIEKDGRTTKVQTHPV